MSDARPTREEWDALAERCETWKALVVELEKLLVCYRIGAQPRGKTLDTIHKLKARLGLAS